MTMNPRSLAACAMALTMSLLSACGGGDGAGGGASVAGVGSGGTGANGSVTGFGSIVVNGIHYDQSKALVTDANGLNLSPAQIQLGMVVDLDGSPITQAGGRESAEALNIRVKSALLGKVDDKGTDTLTIMGQKVSVTSKTHFGDELPGKLDSLAVGELAEVYGFHDAREDVFVATRIERKSSLPTARYQVRGVIQDLDLLNGRCRIGKQVIDYKWSTGQGMMTPANGDVAIAWVSPDAPQKKVLPDGSVQYVWTGRVMALDTPVSPDLAIATLDGLVSSVDAKVVGRFAVNGVTVDASKINCGAVGCASLRVGDHVAVRGSLAKNVLTASRVQPGEPF